MIPGLLRACRAGCGCRGHQPVAERTVTSRSRRICVKRLRTYGTGPVKNPQWMIAPARKLSSANEIVNLHAERVGDPGEYGECRVAGAALDLLQRVLVNASQLRDDAAGLTTLLPDPAYPRADCCR